MGAPKFWCRLITPASSSPDSFVWRRVWRSIAGSAAGSTSRTRLSDGCPMHRYAAFRRTPRELSCVNDHSFVCFEPSVLRVTVPCITTAPRCRIIMTGTTRASRRATSPLALLAECGTVHLVLGRRGGGLRQPTPQKQPRKTVENIKWCVVDKGIVGGLLSQ